MLDTIIIQKLDEHDKRFDAVDKRFDAIDKRLDEHDKRFDAVDKRFDAIDVRLDKLTVIAIEHGERIDQMVTKDEFNAFRMEQTSANDQIITILKRLDEERFATIEWLRRVEREVEDQKKITQKHEVLLEKIKKELKLAF